MGGMEGKKEGGRGRIPTVIIKRIKTENFSLEYWVYKNGKEKEQKRKPQSLVQAEKGMWGVLPSLLILALLRVCRLAGSLLFFQLTKHFQAFSE